MENGFTISIMKKQDLPKVFSTINGLFNKYDKLNAKTTLKYHFKSKEFGINDGNKYWIGNSKDSFVGFVGLEHTIQDVGFISWIAVKRRLQGKGYGKLLLKFAMGKAQEQGCKVLCIKGGSLASFKKANRLYEELGFKGKFKIKDYWADGDDLILWYQKLHPDDSKNHIQYILKHLFTKR
ncbi:GNAT family N-acetyltransferase [Candidatus Woesearchaeota archaeon]|nr:GNAT family N-acetyltransferase [Candidatus Woesearchaeota archaeon]